MGVLVDADMGKIAFFCNGVLQRWVSGLDCRAGTDMYRYVTENRYLYTPIFTDVHRYVPEVLSRLLCRNLPLRISWGP